MFNLSFRRAWRTEACKRVHSINYATKYTVDLVLLEASTSTMQHSDHQVRHTTLDRYYESHHISFVESSRRRVESALFPSAMTSRSIYWKYSVGRTVAATQSVYHRHSSLDEKFDF